MENTIRKFDVLLEAEDYVYHDFHSFFGKGNMIKKIVMIISYIIVFLALITVTIKFWYLFPLTSIIIFYPLILRYMAEYRFKSYITRKLREQLIYTLNEQQLTIKGETFTNSYFWSDFKEVTEGRKAFYFWETDAFALLLPKRFLVEKDMEFVRKVGKIT